MLLIARGFLNYVNMIIIIYANTFGCLVLVKQCAIAIHLSVGSFCVCMFIACSDVCTSIIALLLDLSSYTEQASCREDAAWM